MLNIKALLSHNRPTTLVGVDLFRYQYAAQYIQNKRVLDVGTGIGLGAFLLSQQRPKRVVGIDISNQAIAYARSHFISKNLTFQNISALNIDNIPRSFDAIIAFEIIEHLPKNSYLAFLDNLSGKMSSNGVLLLSTPNKLVTSPQMDKPHNPYHIHEFTPQEIYQLLKQRFSSVKLMGIKMINKAYLRKRAQIESGTIAQLTNWVSKYRFTHWILPFIPIQLKNLITKRHRLKQPNYEDFAVTETEISDCEWLYLIAKHPLE